MKETTFINQNKKKWAKFEKMSKTQQNDPDEMSRLFVELTDDLAFARTYYPKRSVRVYLNSLAQRVFHDLYKKKREPFSKFLTFWTKDLPLEMYRAQKSLLVAFVIFVVGMLIGIVSTIDNEDFLGAVIGYDYVQMAEGFIAEGKPMNVYGQGPESITFGQIAMNNMRVAIITFVLGIFFSLGSSVYLFFNSIMVGAFQWFYVVRNLTLASFLTIWIHGAFEIPAIILAAAAGITMGNGLLFPGTLTRMQSLIISAKRGIKMMIGIIPFILMAAFIEGYATRNTVITTHGEPIPGEWPVSLKWLFILGCFAIVIFYFVIYPIMVARKEKFDGKVIERPQFKEVKLINLNRIKDVGEVFTDTFISYAKVFGTYLKLFSITIVANVAYVIYLFQQPKTPFFEYQTEVSGGNFIIFDRGEKILENLEILFTWNQYFQLDLFLIQTLLFAFNAFNILYLFRRFISKNIDHRTKSYFALLGKSIIPLVIAFAVMGAISAFAPFALMLLIGIFAPLLIMWALPLTLSKISIGKGLGEGFRLPWKSFWGGVGLFFFLITTLFIIYTFVGVPLDMFKDMTLEWFVLPIADEPQYIFAVVDAAIYLTICHLIFPILIIGFAIFYYSIKEQDEAVGMFKNLPILAQKVKYTKQQMKALSKMTHISLVWAFLVLSQFAFGQSSQEEYLQSNPKKTEFNTNQWGKLKGKMRQESSGSNSPSGDGFSGSDFSTEQGPEGSAYDYEPEEYKGEYSEYQNFEDPDNEYDEDYDNYEHQDNYYQNDKEYGDGEYNKYDKSKSPAPVTKPKKPKKRNPNSSQSSEGFLTFWKVLAFIVIGGLIAYFIYYFFMRYGGSETGSIVHMDFDDVPPSEIPKTELERRLEDALAKEDFREAIRIYFIFIIKDLSDKEWINWERKKTNMSYLMEMRSKPQFDLFNETVSIYDIVWYGNYAVTKSNYNDVEPKFKQLLSAINA